MVHVKACCLSTAPAEYEIIYDDIIITEIAFDITCYVDNDSAVKFLG